MGEYPSCFRCNAALDCDDCSLKDGCTHNEMGCQNTKCPFVVECDSRIKREYYWRHSDNPIPPSRPVIDDTMVNRPLPEFPPVVNHEHKEVFQPEEKKELGDDEYPWLDKQYTNIDQKRANFPKFVELIKNQFWHGGSKYRLNNEKEYTDHLCESFPGRTGIDGVLWTMGKYLARYQNFGREKDLLKIATYCFILWLKAGAHLKDSHDEDTARDGKRTDK